LSNNHETRETSHGALETCIKHQGSKNGKLINKFTNSPINSQNPPLQLSRELYKSNLFLQNKANSYHGFGARGSSLSACNITRYVNVRPVGLAKNEQKNKPKQSQFKPNFRPKLASFSSILALFFLKLASKWLAKIVISKYIIGHYGKI